MFFLRARKILVGGFVVMMMLLLCVPVLAAQTEAIEGMDLVFVVDTSLSMRQSDSEGWAKDSVNAMIEWAKRVPPFSGFDKRYGVVLYAGEITGKIPLTADEQQVQDFTLAITNNNSFTDIPRGLLEGVNMLTKLKDKNRLQAIILLTDGKVESTRQQEILDAELESALKEGFPVYTIGLNADGSVDEEYITDIARNTEAKHYIASQALDLNGYYADIFSELALLIDADNQDLVVEAPETVELPADEPIEVVISIPDDGVVEASITIAHSVDLTLCEMTDPNGKVIGPATDPDKIKMMDPSNKMQLIFLEFPVPGDWTLTLQGADEDKVTVLKIYGHDFQAPALSVKFDEPKAGETARFTVQLQLSDDKAILNPTFSELFDCTLKLTDAQGKETAVPVRMEQNGAFLADWMMEAGDYTGTATVALKNQSSAFHESNTVILSINKNALPWFVWLIIALGVLGAAAAAYFLFLKKPPAGPQGSLEYEVKEGNMLLIPRDSYSFPKGKKAVALSTIVGYDGIPDLKQISFIGQRAQKAVVTKIRNDSANSTVQVGSIEQVDKGMASESLDALFQELVPPQMAVKIIVRVFENGTPRYEVKMDYASY